jgi:hypothetical protein
MISALSMPWEIDRRDPQVAVSELALDHDQRHAFVGHLDGMGVAELVRREPSPHTGSLCGVPQFGPSGGV